MNFNRFTIIYGHYGCGKTNLSLNICIELAKQNKSVTLVDLDIVNPYFRSGDYKELLKEYNIKVICPQFLGTTSDTPSLSPQIYSIFANETDHIVIDVGGDDVGAYALGRFSDNILKLGDYEALYVTNMYRSFTSSKETSIEILKEIEKASKIKATALVNNSHLQHLTDANTILDSIEYASDISKTLNIPLAFTTCKEDLKSDLESKIENLFVVKQIVKPPF